MGGLERPPAPRARRVPALPDAPRLSDRLPAGALVAGRSARRMQSIAGGRLSRRRRRNPSWPWWRASTRSTNSPARSGATGPRSPPWSRPASSRTTGSRRPRTWCGSRGRGSSSTTARARAVGRQAPGQSRRGGPAVVVATEGIELLRADLPVTITVTARARARSGPARTRPSSGSARLARPRPGAAAGRDHPGGLAKADPATRRATRPAPGRSASACARSASTSSEACPGARGARSWCPTPPSRYLARRYRLHQVPIMGLSPDSEPSPARLAQIVRFAGATR